MTTNLTAQRVRTLTALAAQALAMTLQFAAGLLVARLGGAAQRGTVAILSGASEPASTVAASGLPAAAGVLGGRPGSLQTALSILVRSKLFLGLTAAPIAVGSAGALVGLSGDQSTLLAAIGATTGILAVFLVTGPAFLTSGDLKRHLLVVALTPAVQCIAIVTFVLVAGRNAFDTTAVIALFVLSATVTLTAVLSTSTRQIVGPLASDEDADRIRRIGAASLRTSALIAISARLDLLIGAIVLSRSDLGLYGVALSISVPLLAVTQGLLQAGYSSTRSRSITRAVTLLVAGATIAGVSAAQLLIEPVYGTEFGSARNAASLLVLAAAARLFSDVIVSDALRSTDPAAAWRTQLHVSGLAAVPLAGWAIAAGFTDALSSVTGLALARGVGLASGLCLLLARGHRHTETGASSRVG